MVEIPPKIKYDLEEMFAKLEQDQFEAGKIFPKYVLQNFKQLGYDKTQPCFYSMMNWICLANQNSGTDSMTFDEMMKYARFLLSA